MEIHCQLLINSSGTITRCQSAQKRNTIYFDARGALANFTPATPKKPPRLAPAGGKAAAASGGTGDELPALPVRGRYRGNRGSASFPQAAGGREARGPPGGAARLLGPEGRGRPPGSRRPRGTQPPRSPSRQPPRRQGRPPDASPSPLPRWRGEDGARRLGRGAASRSGDTRGRATRFPPPRLQQRGSTNPGETVTPLGPAGLPARRAEPPPPPAGRAHPTGHAPSPRTK